MKLFVYLLVFLGALKMMVISLLFQMLIDNMFKLAICSVNSYNA